MGYTFKENCSDMRNTKVENIMYHLTKHGYKVDIFDDHANGDDFKKIIKN